MPAEVASRRSRIASHHGVQKCYKRTGNVHAKLLYSLLLHLGIVPDNLLHSDMHKVEPRCRQMTTDPAQSAISIQNSAAIEQESQQTRLCRFE